jgi:hypothetical protein
MPPVDLPPAMRTSNYGGGSCMHAAWCDVLKWQNQERMANWWGEHYAGAAGVGPCRNGADMTELAERNGLRFAYTDSGDVKFLDWCSRTRRGAAIHWRDAHAITFCGFLGGDAVLLDNNDPKRLQRMPRNKFLSEWRHSGGRAITVVYSPAPPRPWI